MTTWASYVAAVDESPLAGEIQATAVAVYVAAGLPNPNSAVGVSEDDIKEQIELEDLSRAKQTITDLGKDVSDDISTIKGELSDVTYGVKKNIQVHQDLESKCGFFINSPALSWPEENSYVRLRDRLRERNRQRLLKNRKKN